MLTITPTAAELIRALVDASHVPASAGVRISAADRSDDGLALELSLVEAPEPADEVVSEGEASVFVEHELADDLDHTVLDAELGGDGRIQFALRENGGVPPAKRNGSTPH